MSSSRAFAVRAYSVLNGDDNEHDVNHNFYSTLQELTMQLAAEQQEVSNSLEHEHLPDLQKLQKECRDKIQKLKADQSLSADELLRCAELTRAKMTHLDRCCKQADKATGQVEMDPWVANLCLYPSFFFLICITRFINLSSQLISGTSTFKERNRRREQTSLANGADSKRYKGI
jgi:hypothetical protein